MQRDNFIENNKLRTKKSFDISYCKLTISHFVETGGLVRGIKDANIREYRYEHAVMRSFSALYKNVLPLYYRNRIHFIQITTIISNNVEKQS
jgi:hypothetical protein